MVQLRDGGIYFSQYMRGFYFKVVEGNRKTGWFRLAWLTMVNKYHVQDVQPTTVMKIVEGMREVKGLELMLKVPEGLKEVR